MRVFLYAIVLTTKPHFCVKRIYCIKVRLDGKDNSISENPLNWINCYSVYAVFCCDDIEYLDIIFLVNFFLI